MASSIPAVAGLSRHAPRSMLAVAGLRGYSLRLQLAHQPLSPALTRYDLAQMHVLASKAGNRQSDAA
jgi:hypothetical protein